MRLSIPPIRQRPGECGPTSLAMVLRAYGLRPNLRELVRRAGTTAAGGASATGILRAARAYGCSGRIVRGMTIAELRHTVMHDRVPVIVDWFSHDDGHYSVVIGVTRARIVLQDPERMRPRMLALDHFERVWFDYPDAVPKDAASFLVRWAIVIDRPRAQR